MDEFTAGSATFEDNSVELGSENTKEYVDMLGDDDTRHKVAYSTADPISQRVYPRGRAWSDK